MSRRITGECGRLAGSGSALAESTTHSETGTKIAIDSDRGTQSS